MAAKKIMVSLPEEDKKFCESRVLSPSKLLQERITQIRDENNPSLVKHLKESRQQTENMKNKLEFLAVRLDKVFKGLEGKLPKEEIDKLIQNI